MFNFNKNKKENNNKNFSENMFKGIEKNIDIPEIKGMFDSLKSIANMMIKSIKEELKEDPDNIQLQQLYLQGRFADISDYIKIIGIATVRVPEEQWEQHKDNLFLLHDTVLAEAKALKQFVPDMFKEQMKDVLETLEKED